jgi:hypothetical protein
MSPYILFGAARDDGDATALSQRLAAWHDAMVAHNRRLEFGRVDDECGEECAHSEARALWAEALTTFGDRAHEFSFLRASATDNSAARTSAKWRQATIMSQPADVITESQEA